MKHNGSSSKRIVSFMLTLVMLFSLVSMGLFQITAADEICSIEISNTGGGRFTFSYVDATGVTKTGTYQTRTLKVPVGTEITLTPVERYTEANPSSAGNIAPFMCWETDKHKIITMNREYKFTATSSRKIFVVFANHPVGEYTVRYVNNAGILLHSFTVPTGSTPESYDPVGFLQTYTVPALDGYDFLGWDQKPDDYKNSTTFVIVRPKYVLIPTTYTLDFTNTSGVSGARTYDAFSKAAAIANPTDSEGKPFLYWKDAVTGEILCYNTLFLFYITRNTTLTAVYGEEPVSGGVCVRIVNAVKDITKGTMTFYSERSATSDLTVVETGILLSTANLNENSFLVTTAGVLKGISNSSANSGLYSLTKKGVTEGNTYYARAYVAYRDANGAYNVAYSGIYTETM
ncbi:MAG: hypothetical protein K5756_06620 [Clostridiales bacterium]|nr:hypothetical protein [Clostridiales bacterium]